MIAIRSAAFQFYLVFVTAAVAILGLPAPLIGAAPTRVLVKLWAQIVLAGLKGICGISHRIEGAENIPGGGAIIACNHQSMWETLVMFTLLPKPVAVFKKELLKIPLYGWWGLRTGSIAVDRDGGARSIRDVKRQAAERIADGAQIVVFPEGTRGPVGGRAPLQPGVAAIYLTTSAPVVPAGHDSGRYWRHPGWRKVPGTITLRFLPPIAPGLDRKTFMSLLAERIDEARPDLPPRAGESAASPRRTEGRGPAAA